MSHFKRRYHYYLTTSTECVLDKLASCCPKRGDEDLSTYVKNLREHGERCLSSFFAYGDIVTINHMHHLVNDDYWLYCMAYFWICTDDVECLESCRWLALDYDMSNSFHFMLKAIRFCKKVPEKVVRYFINWARAADVAHRQARFGNIRHAIEHLWYRELKSKQVEPFMFDMFKIFLRFVHMDEFESLKMYKPTTPTRARAIRLLKRELDYVHSKFNRNVLSIACQVTHHRVAQRIIYMIACAPLNCDAFQRLCELFENNTNAYLNRPYANYLLKNKFTT